MKRIWFDGCAGWLHLAPGGMGTAGSGALAGVVLCPPQGHEAIWAHRVLRQLADDLAAAGLHTLRFDYPGTGDSEDRGDDGDEIDRAVSSVVAAALQLRALTGVESVVLCGLRLGASIAVLASDAMPPAIRVTGLALIAPVVNGRTYLRELHALQLGWLDRVGLDPEMHRPDNGVMDVLAYRTSANAVRKIGAMRLDRYPIGAVPRVLVLDAWSDRASPAAVLAQRYQEAGAQIELVPFNEYARMMQSAEFAAEPVEAWQRVIGWCAPARPPWAARAFWRESVSDSICCAVELDGVIERSTWLDDGRQFGVLCMPAGAQASAVVLFPNTGANHHVGDGRMFVTLSRQLARAGIAALRLDVATIGDSPGARRQVSFSTIYSQENCDDAHAAVEWLRSEGFHCIVVAGVCSGAYLSLQAALTHPAVRGVVLANVPKFRWDRTDDDIVKTRGRSWRDLQLAAGSGDKWKLLLSGKLQVWPLLSAMARQGLRHLRDRTPRRVRPPDHAPLSPTDYARAAVQELDRRGVRVDLLYAACDAGLDEAKERFGENLEALQHLSLIHVGVPPVFDHSLWLPCSRVVFAERLMHHLEWQLHRCHANRNTIEMHTREALTGAS